MATVLYIFFDIYVLVIRLLSFCPDEDNLLKAWCPIMNVLPYLPAYPRLSQIVFYACDVLVTLKYFNKCGMLKQAEFAKQA